jgi:hypothetical protein
MYDPTAMNTELGAGVPHAAGASDALDDGVAVGDAEADADADDVGDAEPEADALGEGDA